jgi:glucose/arabinose dehydrogenase
VALLLGLLACNLGGGQLPPSLPPTVPSGPTSAPPIAPPATEQPTVEPTATPVPVEPTPDRVFSLPDPSGLRLAPVVEGLDRPLGLEHAGDRRIFVVEQRGAVWTLEDGRLQETPYLDLRDRVDDSGFEQGLLGLAFHPDFARNGLLFVNYTNSGGNTVVSRLTASAGAGQVDPATEEVILRIDQPFSNHNGGDLEFGPDGYLYIARPPIHSATASAWIPCWASCCASTSRSAIRMPSRATTLSPPEAACRRSGPTACAIRGALPSTH